MSADGVRRQARGERRIAQILRAAAEVFARDGYEGATTNAIAREAGVSPGSLYQFFRNKDEVAAALAEYYTTELQAAQARSTDGVDPAGQTWDAHSGHGWFDAIHPDDRDAVRSSWGAACFEARRYECPARIWHARTREYRDCIIRATPIRNEDGSLREWVGACMEVHAPREA